MLQNPLIVRFIGLIFILFAIILGRLWWKHFKKHIENENPSAYKDEFYYGCSFIPFFFAVIGFGLLYFGRFT